MSKLRPYCNVCRGYYRGLYGVHASTDKHRRAIHRQNEGKGSNRKMRARHLTVARLNYLQRQADEAKVSVRKHRRSPPNDGSRRVVPVVHYWRDPPYIANRVYHAPKRRRRRRQ